MPSNQAIKIERRNRIAWGDGFRNLTNEIYNMHKEKAIYIRHLTSEIKQKRNDWRAERDQMREGLLANFNAWNKARAKELADLQTLVRAFLAELNESNRERAREVKDLKATVATMITEFKKECEEAAVAWECLMANMGKGGKRNMGKEVKPSIEKKEENKKRKKAIMRNDNEKKILAIIEDNPEGISLPEAAYIMGVAFVTITRDMKKLLKDGLIKKKENRYFPCKVR